jgi:hypothetical protein
MRFNIKVATLSISSKVRYIVVIKRIYAFLTSKSLCKNLWILEVLVGY